MLFKINDIIILNKKQENGSMLSENDIKKIFEERGVLKQFAVKKEIKDLPEHIDDQGG